jgi:hypothetical protein
MGRPYSKAKDALCPLVLTHLSASPNCGLRSRRYSYIEEDTEKAAKRRERGEGKYKVQVKGT